ncbi:MAG: lytic murein transglycosylase, partial [Methylococcaceae bacterium]|nr:lytic murein transglycosylase [Methylococcaceae bacterium]
MTQLQTLLVLLFTLAGCASHKPARPLPAPLYPSDTLIKRQAPSSPTGNYSAPRVGGDFMGYRKVDEFIARMETKHGFSRDYLNGLFSKAKRKDATLTLMNRQAGSPATTPRPGAWSRYRAKFLTELHIESGAAFWRHHARALQQASERYGVPPEYILGIMGVETIYGRNM